MERAKRTRRAAAGGDCGERKVTHLCNCCAVLFEGEPGAQCGVVPLWELKDWTCPGNCSVPRSLLCSRVVYGFSRFAAALEDYDATLAIMEGGGGAVSGPSRTARRLEELRGIVGNAHCFARLRRLPAATFDAALAAYAAGGERCDDPTLSDASRVRARGVPWRGAPCVCVCVCGVV